MFRTSKLIQHLYPLLFTKLVSNLLTFSICETVTLLAPSYTNGAFTLPDIETDKETDKKMASTELCRGVCTAQRQTPTQIPIGFCPNLMVSVSVSGSASVLGSMNEPRRVFRIESFNSVNLLQTLAYVCVKVGRTC